MPDYSKPILDIAMWLDPAMLECEGAFVRHVAMGLKSEGQRVSFIVPDHTDVSLLPVLGSRVISYPLNKWDPWGVLQHPRMASLVAELIADPPDVLVVWGTSNAHLVQSVHSRLTLPTIVWCWDGSELHRPVAQLLQVKHAVAASGPVASRAGFHFRVPVSIIPPGVYCDEQLACYDVENQWPCLVCLDPLSDRAAYEPLLSALKLLAGEGLDFMFFAYDTGREEHAIWQMAAKMGLLDRMSFVPYQQEAEPLLLHGDIYLHALPSTRVQYRTLEAMGRGLAVVGRSNAAADYLTDPQTCRWVAEPTVAAWHKLLAEMITDRPKAIALARRGQQLVRERHTMSRTIEQLLTICRQVAGAPIPIGPIATAK